MALFCVNQVLGSPGLKANLHIHHLWEWYRETMLGVSACCSDLYELDFLKPCLCVEDLLGANPVLMERHFVFQRSVI
jgi:hypothetical protein